MWRSSVTSALEQSGFEVTYSGDIPGNISDYDLVVIFAYYAVEPHLEDLIKNYVSSGGGVVLLAAVPCFFAEYSKAPLSAGLTSISEWFGCSSYVNGGGTAHPAFDNPFGTSLLRDEILPFETSSGSILSQASPSHAAVTSLNEDEDTQPVAFWDSGLVFAFTHEYDYGRVYYQAIV